MKHIFIVALVGFVVATGACTKDNFVKTGLHNGRFDGSLLEYLKASGHSYDWDSTARLVEQAGPQMVRLFEGKDPEHPEITFLGPTNHSIRRYMLFEGYERIADMDPGECEMLLLIASSMERFIGTMCREGSTTRKRPCRMKAGGGMSPWEGIRSGCIPIRKPCREFPMWVRFP